MALDDTFPFRIEFPPELPISSRAEEIVACIQNNQVVILAGETGSGKTTQIPKMCLLAGRGRQGRIACTQPRRVAALSISRRVAEELGVEWGREVGCKVRFSDQTTRETAVKFLTDGMLLAEVQGDPMLRGYDTIIIDEAHERSLNIDFLLGHLRQLRFRRPDLKIVITSATIDTQAFSEAFDGAPVIQVSGRTYPVETIYMPLDKFGSDYVEEEEDPAAEPEDKASAKAEALHYVDGAVEAVNRIIEQGDRGDVLVFMPSERDIRETCDALEHAQGRGRGAVELIPLFGRLSNAEQQRVFAPAQRRKVIVATNIAETSLTLPGIRYVVDTGLSRLSRYSPAARTRRLPIEPVSQSSADQRKGRAGRVAEGVCIRLYSEEDYNARPRFTQPEIQRANLADVILRLKAFGLGDIERFPFINPPAGKAIRSGYALLEELGAVEESPEPLATEAGPAPVQGSQFAFGTIVPGEHVLTPIGRELARLPVDPTVGRMILQARRERCLAEVLVIASGLSIQDPRERPLDKQAAADTAHRRFSHPDSDFLTLLRIWELFHDEVERMSQGKLRRFCHDHFLSYVRMREWRDIHAQLMDVLREREDFRMTSVRGSLGKEAGGERRGPGREGRAGPESVRAEGGGARGSGQARAAASGQGQRQGGRGGETSQAEEELLYGSRGYTVIHRSILAGLLGNIALLDEDTRQYKATNDRKVVLFPGSSLYKREERKRGGEDRREGQKSEKAPKAPRWIMASEIVETSRVYARTNAKLDPRWLVDLGAHLMKVSHSEPFWNPENGRVLVKQRTRLYGLEIETKSVGYGRVNPVHATEIFIREALVADTVEFPLDFIAHNRRVREKIEFSLTRMRDSGYLNLDEALYRFYEARLIGPEGAPVAGLKGEAALVAAEKAGFKWVSCVQELVDLVRETRMNEPDFLQIEPEDLRDPESLQHDELEFPAALPVENRVIPLNYAYKPGQADDGVTLDVNVRDASALTAAALDWAVPGYTKDKVEHYLRSLPKELRKAFVPLSETVPSVTKAVEQLARLRDHGQPLVELMVEHLKERFGFRFERSVWEDKPLPEHLRVRVRVSDDQGRELCASRDLAEVQGLLAARQKELSVASVREDPPVWRQARAKWEKPHTEHWSYGLVPASVVIGEQAGLPLLAYPALEVGSLGVALKLVREEAAAAVQTRAGLSRLLELQLGRELMWLERDLKQLRELGPQLTLIAPLERLQEDLFASLRHWLLAPTRIQMVDTPAGRAHTKEAFDAAVERTREEMQGLVPRLVEQLREVVDLRQVLSVQPSAPPGFKAEVLALLPPDFLRSTPYEKLLLLGRYMRAKKLRLERWRQNQLKDAERAKQLAPYLTQAARHGRSSRFFWLVEEFRVSLFAQELGTAESVSPVKLDAEMKALPAVPVLPEPPPPPASAAPKAGAAAKPVVPSPAVRAQHASEQAAAQAAAKAIALLGKPSAKSPLSQPAAKSPSPAAQPPVQAAAPAAGAASSSGPAKQSLKSFSILSAAGLPAAAPAAGGAGPASGGASGRAGRAQEKPGSEAPKPVSKPSLQAGPAQAAGSTPVAKPPPAPAVKGISGISPQPLAPAAPVAAPLQLQKKAAPIKSLNALDVFLKKK